jgi:hypothetical protein
MELMAFVFALALTLAIGYGLIHLGETKNTSLELSLLGFGVLAQLVLLVLGWGDFGNVHGGAILLMLMAFIGFLFFLGELILTLFSRKRWRVMQLAVVAAFPVLFITLGTNFGK